MISVCIHHSQFLIHARNKVFQVRNISSNTDYTLTLTEGNYGGKELATELVAASTVVAAPITGATFDKDKNSITITGSTDFQLKFKTGTNGYDSTITGYTTPHDVWSPANDISSTSSSLTTGSIGSDRTRCYYCKTE